MGTHYTTNWIVCLASSAMGNVDAIEKRGILSKQGLTFSSLYPKLPRIPLYSTSRVTIVAHGDEESALIHGDGFKWDARQCAEMVKKWFEKNHVKEVKRICFDMCYGAKSLNGGSDSFVRRFASHCDFAAEVVGRTGIVNHGTLTNVSSGKVVMAYRTVDGKTKQAFRKIKFLTTGGSLSRPKLPVSFLCWDGEIDI